MPYISNTNVTLLSARRLTGPGRKWRELIVYNGSGLYFTSFVASQLGPRGQVLLQGIGSTLGGVFHSCTVSCWLYQPN